MRVSTALFCLCLTVACAPPSGGGGGGGASRADAGASLNDAGVECLRSTDCGEGYRCIANACEEIADQGCDNDRDCRIGERCDNSGQCVEAGGNGGCQTDADCTEQGQVCDNGTCKSGAYGECSTDADCADGTRCLLRSQDGRQFCGTLCQSNDGCNNHESCQDTGQGTVCAPTACQTPGQSCDAHGTGDGQCVRLGQAAFCIKGAGNGAGCEPFGEPECEAGTSCQPLSIAAAATYCGRSGGTEPLAPCQNGVGAGVTPFAGDDCAQGNFCLSLQQGTVCVPYCRVGQNTDCPTLQGTTFNCVALSQLDPQLAGSPWGLCQPQQ